ncbi:ParB/RepB/Spo0J family partition protein [Butyricicoccus porcorum]|uniref:ParB/RepB/Spo0J family partition protein n=1 Tax=Butyricicoccus porcorum TaxID=1945634 RepID=UPI0013FDF725|nr:ParB/RepB/Spo0J family partition protein [Butyricicoccus porcorum]
MLKEGRIKISELKPHPQNNYYFDDMVDDVWDDFLQSVRTSGVTNAITITQDKTIISGHQRVRACNVLGIEEISYKMIEYTDEQKEIKDLIESNLKQRVAGNSNPVKLGRCFTFLKDYYGITHGGDRKSEKIKTANGVLEITQEELAAQCGYSVDVLQRAESITKLPQEIQDLVQEGNISPSTASRLIARLSPEEQEQLAASLPATKKLTQKQVQQYIRDISDRDVQIGEQANELVHLKQKNMELQSSLDKAQKPETITVYPDDYDKTKRENKERARDYEILNQEYQKRCQELRDLKEKMRGYEEKSPEKQFDEQLKDDTIFFCAKVSNFLKAVGGYAYLTEHIDGLPQEQRNGYIKAISSVGAWAQNILDCVNKGVTVYE